MNFKHQPDGCAAIILFCLTLFSMPAMAVVEQSVEFPDARDIQGATLSFDDSDEIITGEIQEEDDRKKVVFVLPDGSEGRNATANVIIDGQPQSFSLVVGQPTPVFRTNRKNSYVVETDSGWYFGPGVYTGNLSSDFATRIAQQSAADASALLASQGLTNIASMNAADDSSIGWGAILEVGYQFSDDSRLSLDLQYGAVGDFGLNAGASGDVPMTTSIASAESVATAELDTWSMNLNYARFFTPTSNFGFVVSVGNQSIERGTSFTSTLSVDGVPFDTFVGGETLDENVLQYGAGLEWTQRQARNWVPTIGIRYGQTADLDIFDKEQIRRLEAYFTIKRRPNKRRPR